MSTGFNGLPRRTLLAGLIAGLLTRGRRVQAAMPISMQAELLVKLAAYDRTLRERAGNEVRVLLVTRPGSVESERHAYALNATLRQFAYIAGLPHVESTFAFKNGPDLAAACKQRAISMMFVTPQLGEAAAEAIGTALGEATPLTLAPDANLVRRGIVVGFDLVSSRPRLFCNLPQARKQGIRLSSDVLKLMTVFR